MLEVPLRSLARVVEGRLYACSDLTINRIRFSGDELAPGDLLVPQSRAEWLSAQRVGVGSLVPFGWCSDAAGKSEDVLEVADVAKALRDLAAWHCSRVQTKTVLVTGATAELAAELLQSIMTRQFRMGRRLPARNAQPGWLLSLLDLRPDDEFVVITADDDEARRAARASLPGLVLLSGLTDSGTAGPSAVESLDYLPFGGAVVMDADNLGSDRVIRRLPSGTTPIFFGNDQRAQSGVTGMYLGPEISAGPDLVQGGSRCVLHAMRGKVVQRLTAPVLGREGFRCAMGAAAAAQAVGINWPRIRRGIAEADVHSADVSLRSLPDGGLLLRARTELPNASALMSAISLLGELPGLGRAAVLEFGSTACMDQSARTALAAALSSAAPDHVLLLGEGAAALQQELGSDDRLHGRMQIAQPSEVERLALGLRAAGRVVLVAGGALLDGVAARM